VNFGKGTYKLAVFAKLRWTRERIWASYGIALLGCLAGLLGRFALGHHLVGAPFITFIPAIIIATIAGGAAPGLLSAAIAAALACHFFIPATGLVALWPDRRTILIAFFVISATIVIAIDAAITSTARLTRAMELLRAANDTLESRIAERTADLMAAEAALRQAQKMEAVGQLTGGIAHDFNNLLIGITGSLELLEARLRQSRLDELPRYIAAAQDSASRAASLTQRLLAFSRHQALTPLPTDINTLISGMTDLIGRSIGPGIALHVEASPELWTSLVDPNQLEHALLNLCINASDAMQPGGQLTIQTANRTLDAASGKPLGLAPGDYAALTVRDTGIGMAPEIIERAFDPFFTTKPTGQGTGLGLSMAYGFVRQSGGQVHIQSAPGQGTAICLYLPRHAGLAQSPASPPLPPQAPAASANASVLVVDDEATVRMVIAGLLEDMGHAAFEAEDGPSSLAFLESAHPIDLLITDIGLPGGINGVQLAQAARARRPDLKILFITGYGGDTAMQQDKLATGVQVLTKPFAMASLSARVQDLLAAS
jgi:signal transduction histidine kinase